MRDGDWTVVLMNADATARVAAVVRLKIGPQPAGCLAANTAAWVRLVSPSLASIDDT